jgi:hypothetical protein
MREQTTLRLAVGPIRPDGRQTAEYDYCDRHISEAGLQGESGLAPLAEGDQTDFG